MKGITYCNDLNTLTQQSWLEPPHYRPAHQGDQFRFDLLVDTFVFRGPPCSTSAAAKQEAALVALKSKELAEFPLTALTMYTHRKNLPKPAYSLFLESEGREIWKVAVGTREFFGQVFQTNQRLAKLEAAAIAMRELGVDSFLASSNERKPSHDDIKFHNNDDMQKSNANDLSTASTVELSDDNREIFFSLRRSLAEKTRYVEELLAIIESQKFENTRLRNSLAELQANNSLAEEEFRNVIRERDHAWELSRIELNHKLGIQQIEIDRLTRALSMSSLQQVASNDARRGSVKRKFTQVAEKESVSSNFGFGARPNNRNKI
ncbi:hypothetical protein HDU83_007629 [Entophlyctis luteolus]|nr:hypothetical protein HDU83_007629 [Entophlyctis luteolus]KAJ3377055.1 hypothetical protein HDU84_009116 [Entophlyctis sp. JEL0112]